jgi:alpha-beta hydrolase superfamily lysophospholipase
MQTIAAQFDAHLDNVEITTPDGTPLRAWHIQRDHSNGNAVILLHGLGDYRLGTVGYADLFLAHGYDVLMPDARAHGASGGQIATYGVLERNDIQRWFEWLQVREHPQCIYGLAESMGAAQLLQSLNVEPHSARLSLSLHFQIFVKLRTTEWVSILIPGRGLDGLCSDQLSKSLCCTRVGNIT